MGIMDWLRDFFLESEDAEAERARAPVASIAADDPFDIRHNFRAHVVNPATGLPMIDGPEGADAGGNPFGVDLQRHGEPVDQFAEPESGRGVGPDEDFTGRGGESWTDGDGSNPFSDWT